MREEYNVEALNPRKNPYAKAFKKPVTMNISVATIQYFKICQRKPEFPTRQ